MKKFFSFATLVALVLGCLVFTSCSDPAPYEGKYYNTEFARITDAEYQTYWNGTTTEVRFAHRATWSEKSSHEKKTNLKDYELKTYLKSKMVITDEEIQEMMTELETKYSYYWYNISGKTLGTDHNILIVELAE